MLEELKVKVSGILEQFQREELGNRLTNFSTAALRLFVIEAFDKVIAEEKEKVKEEKKDG